MIEVLIEAERGSPHKNVYDEKTFAYKGRRQGSTPYPYPYGFVTGTTTADGGGVDCYLITEQRVEAGTRVACEAIGLLEQFEDGELDHKVLATLPGQNSELGQDLLDELSGFIYAAFAESPNATVKVGRILSKREALDYVSRYANE